MPNPIDEAAERYVGWCRYKKTLDIRLDGGEILTFESCDSDAEGAFKVYRESALTAARQQGREEQLERDRQIIKQFAGDKSYAVRATVAKIETQMTESAIRSQEDKQ